MLVRNLQKKGDYAKAIIEQKDNLRIAIQNDQNVADARKRIKMGIIPLPTQKQKQSLEETVTNNFTTKIDALNNLRSIFSDDKAKLFINGDEKTPAMSTDDMEYLNIYWDDLKLQLQATTGLTLKYFRKTIKNITKKQRANYGYYTGTKRQAVNTTDELRKVLPDRNVLSLAVTRMKELSLKDPRAVPIFKELVLLFSKVPSSSHFKKITLLPPDKQRDYYDRFEDIFSPYETNPKVWDKILGETNDVVIRDLPGFYPNMLNFEQRATELYKDLDAEPEEATVGVSPPTATLGATVGVSPPTATLGATPPFAEGFTNPSELPLIVPKLVRQPLPDILETIDKPEYVEFQEEIEPLERFTPPTVIEKKSAKDEVARIKSRKSVELQKRADEKVEEVQQEYKRKAKAEFSPVKEAEKELGIEAVPLATQLRQTLTSLQEQLDSVEETWGKLRVQGLPSRDVYKAMDEADPFKIELKRLTKLRKDLPVQISKVQDELRKTQEAERAAADTLKQKQDASYFRKLKELDKLPESTYEEAATKIEKFSKYLKKLEVGTPFHREIKDKIRYIESKVAKQRAAEQDKTLYERMKTEMEQRDKEAEQYSAVLGATLKDEEQEEPLSLLLSKKKSKSPPKSTGRGISIPPTSWANLGKFLINESLLEQGALQVKTPNGSSIKGFGKKLAVSDNLQAILLDLIETKKLRGLSDLDNEERSMIETLLTKAGLGHGLGIKKIFKADDDAVKVKRFSLVKGIYDAGNNSKEVRQELRSLIEYFVKTHRLDKKQGMEAMTELK